MAVLELTLHDYLINFDCIIIIIFLIIGQTAPQYSQVCDCGVEQHGLAVGIITVCVYVDTVARQL